MPKSKPTSKAKSKPKSKPKADHGARGTGGLTFGSIVDSVLEAGRDLSESTNPLDAELFGSVIVAMLEDDPNARPERRLELVDRLIERLPARRNADTVAILLGLAATLPDPSAARARSAAARLEARGAPAPAWGQSVGRARFVEAWAATDAFGDQDMIVASFQHPGHPAHAISLTADHNFRGLFRQAAIGVDPDAVRATWAQVAQMPLKPISAHDLARRWVAGTRMYRLYLDPPVYEDVPRVMALLEARASALPAPPEPEDPAELTEADRAAFIGRLLASPFAAGLDVAPANLAVVVADHLIDFRDAHGEGDLLRWSPAVVEIAMLDWLPRKAVLNDDEIDAVPDVLRAFVHFAAEQKGLADDDLAQTLAAIDQFDPEFREAMADSTGFGSGKQLALQMLLEGVDINDAEAVERWIDTFNRRSSAERDEILGLMPPTP